MATRFTSLTALSSAGGVVGPLMLDPLAKSTTVMMNVTTIGGSNAVVTLQMSLDDPSALGAGTTTWATLSSAAAMLSSNTDGLVYTVLSPIAQVRINSTTGSTTASTYKLTALQSVTA